MNSTAAGVVGKHLDSLRVRNLRPASVYNRGRVLARLTAWTGGPILYLTEDDLAGWQARRSTQVSPASLRAELSGVVGFYRWAVRERLIETDPTSRLLAPRLPRRHPRPLSETGFAAAMAAADPKLGVVLGLAGFAGLRACEIAALAWADVDLAGRWPHLRVTGKGGHERTVPVSAPLATLLGALPGRRRGPVVARWDGKGGHARPHSVSQRANRHLAGVGAGGTLHQLRHRFATVVHAASKDVRVTQELLGHASPATTAVYTAVSSVASADATARAGHIAA